MSSNVLQKKVSIDTLNELNSLEERFAELSLRIQNFNNGIFLYVSSVPDDSFKKCLDDIESIATKVDTVIKQHEIDQEDNGTSPEVIKTFDKLGDSLDKLRNSLIKCLERKIRILRVVRVFLNCLFVEAILWLFLYLYCGASKEGTFVLFTILLIPQVLLGYFLMLLRIGKRIVTLYKRKHI